MTDVIMPQMGESIAEGTITKWMKKVGDKVERDEPLFEISTDKVDAEIPAPAAGVLKEIRVQPGTTVAINTVVGVIGGEGEAASAGPAASAQPAAPPPAAPQAPAPPAPPAPPAASVSPAPPSRPPAPPVSATPPPAAPPGSPARPQAAAQSDGASTAAPPSATASPTTPRPGAPLGAAEAPGAVPPRPAPAPEKPRAEMTVDELRQTRSSPVVRKIAAEHNVDIRQIPGTGIAGRVTKTDILGHIETRPSEAPAPAPPGRPQPSPGAPATPFVPAYHPGERVEIVPMSPIRRKTAEHMVLSKRISAHVTTVFEMDMARVDGLRKKYRQQYEERSGVKLTYLPFILKATIDAIKAFPILNSSVEGDSIVHKHDINIGLAVALDWGLIVPVIRNADEKNILGLARAVNDLADRARNRKLKVDEVQGGTFTVTNPGVFGSLFGTPIINQPQVAILGIGTIEKRAVVRDDAIAIRTMAFFALSFDHRIVDGADADRFMAHMKKGLQEFDESAL
jgi:pyruvate dehydrogenase E2 component (dihydrolipoamide acetyltransferase)